MVPNLTQKKTKDLLKKKKKKLNQSFDLVSRQYLDKCSPFEYVGLVTD